VKCAEPTRTTGSRTGRALNMGLWVDRCLRLVNATLASRRIADRRETLRVVFDGRRSITSEAKVRRVARHIYTDRYMRFWEVSDGGKPTAAIERCATREEFQRAAAVTSALDSKKAEPLGSTALSFLSNQARHKAVPEVG
jgi:hypothetical protein